MFRTISVLHYIGITYVLLVKEVKGHFLISMPPVLTSTLDS